MRMGYLAASATFFAVMALASTSALAADCGADADADEANAKCYPTLQAAVDAALAADLPLVLPRGSYRGPVVIDYTAHAGTGFELISHGATINGTLTIECSTDCFYFHQEGTLFINANAPGYAVTVGKPDLSDPQNSIKFDHLIVNNGGGPAVQLNYVLDADLFIVADSGANIGLDIEQMQFSTLRGAASAPYGTAINFGPGYIFANTFQGLDLEASPVCISDMSNKTTNNTWNSPYLNCQTGLIYGHKTSTLGVNNWQLGGAVRASSVEQ